MTCQICNTHLSRQFISQIVIVFPKSNNQLLNMTVKNKPEEPKKEKVEPVAAPNDDLVSTIIILFEVVERFI